MLLQSSHPTPVLVGPASVMYCKLHHPTPLYRKINYLVMLTISRSWVHLGLDRAGDSAEPESATELGNLIRTQILEQAYDVGKRPKESRNEASDKAATGIVVYCPPTKAFCSSSKCIL